MGWRAWPGNNYLLSIYLSIYLLSIYLSISIYDRVLEVVEKVESVAWKLEYDLPDSGISPRYVFTGQGIMNRPVCSPEVYSLLTCTFSWTRELVPCIFAISALPANLYFLSGPGSRLIFQRLRLLNFFQAAPAPDFFSQAAPAPGIYFRAALAPASRGQKKPGSGSWFFYSSGSGSKEPSKNTRLRLPSPAFCTSKLKDEQVVGRQNSMQEKRKY